MTDEQTIDLELQVRAALRKRKLWGLGLTTLALMEVVTEAFELGKAEGAASVLDDAFDGGEYRPSGVEL